MPKLSTYAAASTFSGTDLLIGNQSGTTKQFAASLLLAAQINTQTGTSYTLLSTDQGKIVTLNNASAIAVTVPSGLGAGFQCTIIQLGAGQATMTGSGATVSNRSSVTKTAGQYAVVSLIAVAANVFILCGDGA